MATLGNTFSEGTRTIGGSKPVWKRVWGKVEGGFTLDPSLIVSGTLYPAGTLVEYDKDTHIATVPTAITAGNNYGLTENDILIDVDVKSASCAVVYHGEVIEKNIPTLIADAKAELKMIQFV